MKGTQRRQEASVTERPHDFSVSKTIPEASQSHGRGLKT